MATFKYFHGETELKAPYGMLFREFEAQFPGVKGRKYDGYHFLVANPASETPVFDQAKQKWLRTVMPVERVIEYKSNPSKHKCDDRCVHATGRVMKCECSCGGANHGKGH